MQKACKRSLIAYFTACVLLLLWFWVVIGATDGFLYSIATFHFVLPPMSFAVSLIWSRRRSQWWLSLPILFGLTAPAMNFCTYRLIAFVHGGVLHPPAWNDTPRLIVCSVIGLVIGQLLRAWDKRKTVS